MKLKFILVIVLIPVLIYLFSAITVVYDKEFYTTELAKLGSSEKLVACHEKIANYLTQEGTLGSLDAVEGISAAEKSHLADVKDLMNDLPIVFIVLSLLFFSLLQRIKEKRKVLLYGGILAAAIPLFLYVIPFDSVFNLFHQIFFPQGNWMFSPDSLLIQVYPSQFFKDAAFRIFGQGFIVGNITAILSFLSSKTGTFIYSKIYVKVAKLVKLMG